MGASREAGNLHCHRGGCSLKAQEFACRFYKLLDLKGCGGGGARWVDGGQAGAMSTPLIPIPPSECLHHPFRALTSLSHL